MEKTQSPTYLLCRWLNPNASRAESDRHFSEFRQHAYKVLQSRINYLVFTYQLSGESHGQAINSQTAADKLLHELLVRLCILAKDERPKAIKIVQNLNAIVSPPQQIPPSPQQLKDWQDNLNHWNACARDFFKHPYNSDVPVEYEFRAKEINTQIRLLQTDGYQLLGWLAELDLKTENIADATPEFNEEIFDLNRQNIRQAIKQIRKLYNRLGSQKADLRLGVSQGAKFVIDVSNILDNLLKIQIPGIGLLFHWAEWVAIDLKRIDKSLGNGLTESALDGLDADDFPYLPQRLQHSDTMALEQWLGMQRIDSLLHAPIQQAKLNFRMAKTVGAKQQAQKRLERAKSLYIESMNVFMLAIDGYSREEIAAYLGMTEDKVRGRKAYIAEILAPDFIEAYRNYQGEKLMHILVKLSDKAVDTLFELAKTCPPSNWPGKIMESLLRLPQTQAGYRLTKAEHTKRRAEDRLVEKFLKTTDPLTRNVERQVLIAEVMATDHWDKRLLVRLAMEPEQVHSIKQTICKAERAIKQASAELVALQQNYTRRAVLYPAILGLILNSNAANEAAIADQFGMNHVEQLQKYRKRIQDILEHISSNRGD